jgi:glycosyltransferase involved in cell wall biosynthesis
VSAAIRRLRVLIIEPAGEMWGSEQALLDLLLHLDYTRFDVTVACPNGSPFLERARALNVRTLTVPIALLHVRGRWARLLAFLALAALMLRVRPRVVHVNQAGIVRLVALAGRIVNASVLCHVRLLEDARRIRMRTTSPPVARQFVAVSQSVMRELTGSTSERAFDIECVYDPFDMSAFGSPGAEKSSADIRAQFGIPESARVVTLAGRVCENKRQDLLIEAALRGQNEIFYLIVGGDPPTPKGQRTFRDVLIQRTTDAGLKDRVIFTGMRSDISALMSASDLVVLASEEEAFGRVLLEGLALGKHIVAPAAGGPAEIIGADERGLAFRPGDADSLASAICRTLADEAQAMARTRRGAEWVATVSSPRHHADEMMRLYVRLGTPKAAHG